ncbi:MAG: hypothetical protein ACUVTQ_07130 [Desulfotomaculales bacterium]
MRFADKSLPHPSTFAQELSPADRHKALKELSAVRRSNPGGYFNALAAWYRQTRFAAVRAALDEYFRREIARRVGVIA